MYTRDEEGRKEEISKQGQTNKAKQHRIPKAVTFPKKNEPPRVGLEPTTLHSTSMHGHTYPKYVFTGTRCSCCD